MIAKFKQTSDNDFTLNDVYYKRVFIAKLIANDYVQVICAYDSFLEILEPTHFSNIMLNDVIYSSAKSLIKDLKDVLYYKLGTSIGGSNSDDNNIIKQINIPTSVDFTEQGIANFINDNGLAVSANEIVIFKVGNGNYNYYSSNQIIGTL